MIELSVKHAFLRSAALLLFVATCLPGVSTAQSASRKPWDDRALPPDRRAELVLQEMTLEEKLSLLHGNGVSSQRDLDPAILLELNGGVGLIRGIPRLGIPPISMADAAYGVRGAADTGRYATALPANVALAATWDPEAACEYGGVIGRELRSQGFDMTLGGGANLAREPRNGRTFEYLGEDPLLAGILVGQRIRCEGRQHVISEIKHLALNDQESGRREGNVQIGERAAHESDLLAFEIGIKTGKPQAVMCSYNSVNGAYACENPWLLTDVLRKQWGFPGFVISDWGATHSTLAASAAGMDTEQPGAQFFGEPFKAAVASGKISLAELDGHARRILWAIFDSGIYDNPPKRSAPDPEFGLDVAQRIAERSIVLLRNEHQLLPLNAASLRSLAVIGDHADAGLLSGGGSAQVDPPGSPAGRPKGKIWFPPSPLDAIQRQSPETTVRFASGDDIQAAVELARTSQVAIVFASQAQAEESDLDSLTLPGRQDDLIAAVAKANPRTIVVLQAGSPVTMPWLAATGGVLDTFYPGSRGAAALTNILFGKVNPGGRLPISFPLAESSLPRLTIAKPAPTAPANEIGFNIPYEEGQNIGYKWYEVSDRPVLFPFGFGLSYTTFATSQLQIAPDASSATITVANTGSRRGATVLQVYARLPENTGEARRLVAFQRVELNAGEKKTVTMPVDPTLLSIWDEKAHHWLRPSGAFIFVAGDNAAAVAHTITMKLVEAK